MSDAIKTEGLFKSYGGVTPAKDVSFSVCGGELRCVIGPNGAGKSTLFKLITGIERADRGNVHIFGEDVTRHAPFRRVRLGVGVKLQSNHAYKDLDVAHNMRVADMLSAQVSNAMDRGAGVARESALELFGIVHVIRQNSIVRELSHAEQQWLEICCAISPSVGLLLLDEPTAGMGVEETVATGQALRALQGEGMTIVVVEHDMEFVRQVADRVTVLHQGEIFAQGGMDEVSRRGDVREIYLGS